MANRNKKSLKTADLFKGCERDLTDLIFDLPIVWGYGNYPNLLVILRAEEVMKDGRMQRVEKPHTVGKVVGTTLEMRPFLTTVKLLFGKDSEKAIAKILKYFQKHSTLDRLSDGRISIEEFIEEKAIDAANAGMTVDSTKRFIGSLISSEARFLGNSFTSYYDLPELEAATIPTLEGIDPLFLPTTDPATLPDEQQDQTEASKNDQDSMSIEQLIDPSVLHPSRLTKTSIIRILNAFEISHDPKAKKAELLELINSKQA